MLPALLLLLACASDGSPPPEASGCVDPAARPETDACIAQRIAALPGPQAAQVVAAAARIEDPMLRGATVSRWVAEHAGSIPSPEGQQLCALLDHAAQANCSRRLSSPHLQAP